MNRSQIRQKNEMKMIWDIQKTIKQEAITRTLLMKLKSKLLEQCDLIEESQKVEYTGWYVLLKKKADGYECLGIVNPFQQSKMPTYEWDLSLPIPKPETMPEFQGW